MSKIAVIGVHGVGDQQPGETARAVASLLQSDSAPVTWSYGGFSVQSLSLSVEKFSSCNSAKNSAPGVEKSLAQLAKKSPGIVNMVSGVSNMFDERSSHQKDIQENSKIKRNNKKATEKKAAHEDPKPVIAGVSLSFAGDIDLDVSISFMKDQVINYNPRDADCMDRENATYETICLSGHRQQTKPHLNEQKIDVYEFYWADLSRLGKGMFEVLTNFYQLVFHLCSLGRNVLDDGEPDFNDSTGKRDWRWLVARRMHACTNFGLTLLAPILNLCLLAVLLIILPANVPRNLHFATGIGVSVLFVLGGLIVGRSVHGGVPSRRKLGSAITIIGLFVGVAMGTIAIYFRSDACYFLLTEQWLLLATAGICYAIYRYSEVKQQATVVGGVILVFMWMIVLWRLRCESNSYEGTALVAMQSAVVLLLALVVTWFAMGATLLVVGGVSFPEWGWLKGDGKDTRKQRSLGTAFLSLVLPISLFAGVTISAYTPLLYFATTANHAGEKSNGEVAHSAGLLDHVSRTLQLPTTEFQLPYFDIPLSYLGLDLSTKPTLPKVALWMFECSTSVLYPILLLLWICAFGLAVNSFYWSAMVEGSRPNPSNSEHSEFIGTALTRGFRRLGWVFLLLLIGFPIILWLGGIVEAITHTHSTQAIWITHLYKMNGIVVTVQGTVLAALVLTGRLDDVARFAWPPLDIILDVDNYLRGRPSNQTPKARIAARYLALLKHVAAQGYDKVVIVAHSQGTVITADLFRFLRSFPEPKLQSLGFNHVYSSQTDPHHFDNLYLITMGCPLRQLYGWRFPSLYAWARHDGVNSKDSSAATNNGPATIGPKSKPDPRALGVKRWINAYCSGDYVGRNLWRDDKLEGPSYNAKILYQPWGGNATNESLDGTEADYTRRELCFGVGAHTHYFQDNGKEILMLINQLLS
jgi:hypothetical protein